MESLFLKYLATAGFFKYIIVFLGMFIGGDEILFVAGYLVREDILRFAPTVAAALGGVFVGDLIWYWLGARYQNSSFFLIRFFRAIARPLDCYLTTRPFYTIFISKFIYCLNHATIFRAGALHVPLRIFLRANICALVLWVFIVGGLGYVSSASFALGKRVFKFTEVGLLIGLIVFILLERFVSYILKKELNEDI